MTSDFWLLTSDSWILTSDFWLLTSDIWLLTSDSWILTSDFWLLTSDFWLLTSDYWLLTSDYWLLTLGKSGCVQKDWPYNRFNKKELNNEHLPQTLFSLYNLYLCNKPDVTDPWYFKLLISWNKWLISLYKKIFLRMKVFQKYRSGFQTSSVVLIR